MKSNKIPRNEFATPDEYREVLDKHGAEYRETDSALFGGKAIETIGKTVYYNSHGHYATRVIKKEPGWDTTELGALFA